MLSIFRRKKFKQDIDLLECRGKDLGKLKPVLEHLVKQNPLPKQYKDHLLKGELSDCRECHIEPDWLLIYSVIDNDLVLIRTGSHSDLFR